MPIKYLIIGISVVWFLSEIFLGLIKHSRQQSADNLDKSSFRFLWIVIVISVTIGVFIGLGKTGRVVEFGPWLSICGISFIIAGLVIRWIAILTLKKYFTVDVAVQRDHRLLTSGIYKHIRHPSYSGSLLSFIGLGLSFSNWLTLVVVAVPVFIAFYYRIRVEEKVMASVFKTEYAGYRSRTKKLIPFII